MEIKQCLCLFLCLAGSARAAAISPCGVAVSTWPDFESCSHTDGILEADAAANIQVAGLNSTAVSVTGGVDASGQVVSSQYGTTEDTYASASLSVNLGIIGEGSGWGTLVWRVTADGGGDVGYSGAWADVDMLGFFNCEGPFAPCPMSSQPIRLGETYDILFNGSAGVPHVNDPLQFTEAGAYFSLDLQVTDANGLPVTIIDPPTESSVPEPASLGAVGLLLLLVAVVRRRQN